MSSVIEEVFKFYGTLQYTFVYETNIYSSFKLYGVVYSEIRKENDYLSILVENKYVTSKEIQTLNISLINKGKSILDTELRINYCENINLEQYFNIIKRAYYGTFYSVKTKIIKLNDKNRLENGNRGRVLNQILYGPTGTGKTFDAISKSLEIIDLEKFSSVIDNHSKRNEVINIFNNLIDDGQISFCTFHKSYGYADFIEDIKYEGNGDYYIKDGVFKKICNRAIESKRARRFKYDFDISSTDFYKISLEKNSDYIFEYFIESNCIAIDFGNVNYSNLKVSDDMKNSLQWLNNKFTFRDVKRFKLFMKRDDIIVLSDGSGKIRAIGKVIGDYIYSEDSEIPYNHFRAVEWLYVSDYIDEKIILINKKFSNKSIYMIGKFDLNIDGIRSLISERSKYETHSNNYVLIIDDINKANISNVFGEALGLVDEDRRKGEKNHIKIMLPYSNDKFSVPRNLYIIGIMNTDEKSIFKLDSRVHKNFEMIEYKANEIFLAGDVEGINISEFFKIINKRIEYLLDKEHTIGHSYFIKDNIDFEMLVAIIKNRVIPIIKEYFNDDLEKVGIVLGGIGEMGDNNFFISKEDINIGELFNSMLVENISRSRYTIVENPSKEAFRRAYGKVKKDEYQMILDLTKA